nr:thioredoxin family protein [Methylomarinum sp. Ch1-1]MDP4519525.1 thioredoxin family protein [Methylomarinum sp. Ch1-1]
MNTNIKPIAIGNMLRLVFCLMVLVAALTPTVPKAATALQQSDSIDLYYFWSRYCPHCKEAKPFIESLAKKYSWLTLHSYDLVGNRDNQKRYLEMAKRLGRPANSVPAFIFCGQMMVGYDRDETTGRELEKKLLSCHQPAINPHTEMPVQFNLPGLGQVHYQDFSLPVFTLIISALDAFNPCAFFVLFFLLSLMVHHRSRARMLVIGTTFVLCSGIMYFLFMAAWLNLFLLTEQLVFITAIAGLIAIGFGLINIKDYFYFKQGVSLSLSDSAISKLTARIRGLTQTGDWATMIVATLILAIAANSYELLCTAGLPMVFTRVLTLNELSVSQYYLYLLLYNVIYIIPLLLIVVLFTLTLGRKNCRKARGVY